MPPLVTLLNSPEGALEHSVKLLLATVLPPESFFKNDHCHRLDEVCFAEPTLEGRVVSRQVQFVAGHNTSGVQGTVTQFAQVGVHGGEEVVAHWVVPLTTLIV